MSLTLIIFLVVSLAGTLFFIILFFIKNRNILQLVIGLALLAGGSAVLYFLFFARNAPAPKGDAGSDIYYMIILYACMFLGMLAEHGFSHFTRPLKDRRREKKFDSGPLLLPVFTSPIIFIPLLAALQNVDMDLMAITAPRLMVFFVAFENGFFWKGYRQNARRKYGKAVEQADRVMTKRKSVISRPDYIREIKFSKSCPKSPDKMRALWTALFAFGNQA